MEEIARTPVARIIWNGHDATTDLKPLLSSVTFTDHEEGAADDVEITLDNSEGLWFNSQYPTEGDTMQLYLGYTDKLIDCGLFQIDELTLSGAPHVIDIKAISSFISKALKTKNSKAFESQTLRQVAQYFCGKHNLRLIDKTENMLVQVYIDRITQEEETDLQFLSRLAKEYGFLFSVKGEKLTFTSYYELDNAPAVKDISVLQLSNYSITEKTYDTYSAGFLRKRDSRRNKIIEADYSDGLSTKNVNSEHVIGNVSNEKQAEQRIRGRLWSKNKAKQSGILNLEGDPSLIAGINFNLTGLGNASGKYHITTSTHKISGDGAYLTSLEIRKTGSVPKPQRVPPPKSTKSAYDENTSDAEKTIESLVSKLNR